MKLRTQSQLERTATIGSTPLKTQLGMIGIIPIDHDDIASYKQEQVRLRPANMLGWFMHATNMSKAVADKIILNTMDFAFFGGAKIFGVALGAWFVLNVLGWVQPAWTDALVQVRNIDLFVGGIAVLGIVGVIIPSFFLRQFRFKAVFPPLPGRSSTTYANGIFPTGSAHLLAQCTDVSRTRTSRSRS